ncbi:MAG TPA: lipoprotein-releasing ABC transporter ATP-binding protein LolD [Gammaproteobacteria bacterium]|nr:lipoprotein-releasing ABC transporter ATP-binding protein LolD [Gammaproteobacteria bacterium]
MTLAVQANEGQPIIECRRLTKTYKDTAVKVEALKGVDLRIWPKEKISILGASGSGKSTLLHLLGGLDTPSGGEVFVAGQNMGKLSDADRGRLRNRALGFIYQFHHLLPEFTALENVAMPLVIRGEDTATALAHAARLLDRLGLKGRKQHKPGELSGGERQRVAVGRALITAPHAVLADEPTGNLDRKTAEQIYALMAELNEEIHTSLVIVTHDPSLAERMDKVYTLEDGQLRDD